MILPEIKNFNLFDIGFIIVTCGFIIFGYLRGIVKEILSLCSWAISIAICLYCSDYLGELLVPYISQVYIRKFLAYLIPFVLSITFFLILTSIISEKIEQTRFNLANRPLGGIFGIVKSCIIAVIAYVCLMIFDQQQQFTMMHEAKVADIFKSISSDILVYIKTHQDRIKGIVEELGAFPKLPAKQPADKTAQILSTPQISKSVLRIHSKPKEDKKSMMDELRDKQRKLRELIHDGNIKQEQDCSPQKSTHQRRLFKAIIDELDNYSEE